MTTLVEDRHKRGPLYYLQLLGWAGIAYLLVMLAWKVAELVPRAYAILSYPFELTYGEGTVLYESLLVKAGAGIYSPPPADQFIAGNYTPIYYWLNSLFASPTAPDFFSGRFISFVSGLLISVLIVLIVTRSTRDLPAGVIGGFLFLCLTQLNQQFVFYKPDVLALLFTAAGIFFMTRKGLLVFGAVPFFLLAFYTKQSMVAAPLVAAAYLHIRDRDRRAIAFTAALALGVVVPVAILDLQTSHGFFTHIVSFNQRDWLYSQFATMVYRVASLYRYQFIAAGILVLLQLKERRLSYPVLYLLAAAAMTLTAGSIGSGRSYTLELGLAACIAVGLLIKDLMARRTWPKFALLLVTLVLLGLQAQAIFAMPARLLGREVDNANTSTGIGRMVNLVRQAPDPVLSENVGLLVMTGRKVPYDDPFLMAQTAKGGQWDQSGLIGHLQNKEFPFLLLDLDVIADLSPNERWSPEVLDAIRANYKILYRDAMFVYVPK
jgi:hypothetical protein